MHVNKPHPGSLGPVFFPFRTGVFAAKVDDRFHAHLGECANTGLGRLAAAIEICVNFVKIWQIFGRRCRLGFGDHAEAN